MSTLLPQPFTEREVLEWMTANPVHPDDEPPSFAEVVDAVWGLVYAHSLEPAGVNEAGDITFQKPERTYIIIRPVKPAT